MPLYLHGLGHFHPEEVIDNAFLESLDIGTNDAWIVERVGIRARRTVLPLDYIRQTKNADPRAADEAARYDNVETGRRAAQLAMARAGIGPADVGLVIAGGCCPGMAIPADACRIAQALGIEAPALDVNSACSSFGAQMHLLAQMGRLPVKPGAPYALVVNPENTTRVVDYSDRASCVLWGDGTSAALVSTEVPGKASVTLTTLDSSPAGAAAVTIPRMGHFAQEGSAVQRFAIKTTLACLQPLLPGARARLAETGGSLRFVGHQANKLVLEAVERRSELAPEQHWYNIEDHGNTGAAGAPTVLSQRWDDLAPGDVVILVVVGSGLSWSSMQIEVSN
jgi:3-oxoacyl-[acyl-carrier-protein] synthase-3